MGSELVLHKQSSSKMPDLIRCSLYSISLLGHVGAVDIFWPRILLWVSFSNHSQEQYLDFIVCSPQDSPFVPKKAEWWPGHFLHENSLGSDLIVLGCIERDNLRIRNWNVLSKVLDRCYLAESLV